VAEDVPDGPPPGSPSGLAATVLRAGTRTIQLLLVGLGVYTLLVGDVGRFANVGVMLGLSLVPDALRYRYALRPQPLVGFLVAAAPFLHAVGALGPYRTVPAFDQVAHALSATLVAGFGYVLVRVVETESDAVQIPPTLRFAFVLIFATSFGLAWEILEFGTGLLASVTGGDPLLAQYGLSDVALDLLFNSLGALVVALWGTQYFDSLRRPLARGLDDDR